MRPKKCLANVKDNPLQVLPEQTPFSTMHLERVEPGIEITQPVQATRVHGVQVEAKVEVDVLRLSYVDEE